MVRLEKGQRAWEEEEEADDEGRRRRRKETLKA